MARNRTGYKPLSEAILTWFIDVYICVTWPWCVYYGQVMTIFAHFIHFFFKSSPIVNSIESKTSGIILMDISNQSELIHKVDRQLTVQFNFGMMSADWQSQSRLISGDNWLGQLTAVWLQAAGLSDTYQRCNHFLFPCLLISALHFIAPH